MKNSKKLLLAIAFALVMPSTTVLCSESTIASEESSEIITLTETSKEAMINHMKTLMASTTTGLIGSHGLIAGASGSHALKKVRRNLTKNNTLSFIVETMYQSATTLDQLNKGIRNNRLGMAVSLATVVGSASMFRFSAASIGSELSKKPTLMRTRELHQEAA